MMSRRVRRFAAVAVVGVIAFAASGCSSSLTDAATVRYHDADGDKTAHITRDDLLDRVEASIKNPKFREIAETAGFKPGDSTDSTDATLTAYWLSQMINETVIAATFDRQHLQLSDDDKKNAQQAVERRFTPDVFNAWPKALKGDLVTAQAELNAVLQTCLSGRAAYHILLRTRAAADAAKRQIEQGQSFADVARDKSIDPSSQQAGLLGCVGPDQYVPEFQKVIETAPVGKLTGPVKTQYGFHIVLVLKWDRRLEQNSQLAQGVAQAASATLDAFVRDMKVHVDPRYGAWGQHSSPNGQTVYNVAIPPVPTPRTVREPG